MIFSHCFVFLPPKSRCGVWWPIGLWVLWVRCFWFQIWTILNPHSLLDLAFIFLPLSSPSNYAFPSSFSSSFLSSFSSSSLSFSCSLFQPSFSLSDGGGVSSTDYSSWPSYYNLLREQYNFAFLYMYRWWLYIMLSYLLKMCPNKSCGYGKKSLYFVTTIQKSVLAKRTR